MDILRNIINDYCNEFNFPPEIVINNPELIKFLITFIPTKILSIEEMNKFVGTNDMCYTLDEQIVVILRSIVDSLYSFYDRKNNTINLNEFKNFMIED